MIWCWRPYKILDRAPIPSDYTCCFGRCSSKIGFIIFTIVNFVLISLNLILSITSGPSRGFLAYLPLFLSLSLEAMMLIYFFFALRTGKPVFMQVIWVYRLILAGLFALSTLFLTVFGIICLAIAGSSPKDRAVGWRLLHMALITFVSTVVYYGWFLYVTYRHYANLRDTRLWRDQPLTWRNLEAQPINAKTQADPVNQTQS